MKKSRPVLLNLNPNIFVRDENNPEFRAHLMKRAEEAKNKSNQLPLEELKKRLSKYHKATTNA